MGRCGDGLAENVGGGVSGRFFALPVEHGYLDDTKHSYEGLAPSSSVAMPCVETIPWHEKRGWNGGWRDKMALFSDATAVSA